MHAADQRLAASLASGNAARAAQIADFGLFGGLSGRRLHARTFGPHKPRLFRANAPMSSRLGHARWHMRVHGASEPSVCGGHMCAPRGACNMRSATAHAGSGPLAHHAAHHTLQFSRPHCTPQISAQWCRWRPATPHRRPNDRFWLFGGFRGGAYTQRRHPNRKNTAVRAI